MDKWTFIDGKKIENIRLTTYVAACSRRNKLCNLLPTAATAAAGHQSLPANWSFPRARARATVSTDFHNNNKFITIKFCTFFISKKPFMAFEKCVQRISNFLCVCQRRPTNNKFICSVRVKRPWPFQHYKNDFLRNSHSSLYTIYEMNVELSTSAMRLKKDQFHLY